MVTANLHAYALRDQINVYPQAHQLAHYSEREDRGGAGHSAMTSSVARAFWAAPSHSTRGLWVDWTRRPGTS